MQGRTKNMPTKNSNGSDLVCSSSELRLDSSMADQIAGTNEFSSISLAAVITGVNGTPTCLES